MRRAALLAALVPTLGLALALRARADCECDPRPLDVVFVIDSTGSMTGAIDAVKKRCQRVLELLRENAPRVRVGVVTYRDVGDEYLSKGIELSEDFAASTAFLKSLVANGGGDTPEAVEAGLEMAYSDSKMRWDEKARKVAILIADAPAHDDKKQLCQDLAAAAKKRGIVTFTVSVDGTVAGFKEIAAAGGGKNVDIAHAEDIARHALALALDRDESEFKEAFSPAATSGEAPHPRLARAAASRPGAFVFQQLRWEGAWDPPHASKRLLRALGEAGIDCSPERRVVRATDEALRREPFLYVTGHGELKLSPDEERALKAFLERGGTILIERCCDGAAFDVSARALAARLSGVEPREVGADHAVFRSGGEVSLLEHATAHATHDYQKRRPVLLEARSRSGRPLVLYSPTDVGCGWSGAENGRSCALRERDALRWTINILLYVLST